MSLARIISKIATYEEMTEILIQLEDRCNRLQSSINWALGENGYFPPKPETKEGEQDKKYWWRSELRERALLDK